MLNEMGKDKGWIVKKMDYEPCMFTVEIEGRMSSSVSVSVSLSLSLLM